MEAYQFVPQLEAFIKTQEGIAGGWNGEDRTYWHEGDMYTEDDAGIARDRAEAAKELLKTINEYDL